MRRGASGVTVTVDPTILEDGGYGRTAQYTDAGDSPRSYVVPTGMFDAARPSIAVGARILLNTDGTQVVSVHPDK